MIIQASDIGRESIGEVGMHSAWRATSNRLVNEVYHSVPAIGLSVGLEVLWDSARDRRASIKWFSYMLGRRSSVQFNVADYVSTLDDAVAKAQHTLPRNRRERLIELSSRIPVAELHAIGQLATARVLWEYKPPAKGNGIEELFSFMLEHANE